MEHLDVEVFSGALLEASDELIVQLRVHHVADSVVPEDLLIL